MIHRLTLAFAIAGVIALPAFAQDSPKHDDNFDIHSSVGDLHVGSDADARKIGLPLYPGSRPKPSKDHDGDSNQANLSLFTEAFGFKLVVASYESDDPSPKILDFYRDKLKKYGKVLECHTHKHGGDADRQFRLAKGRLSDAQVENARTNGACRNAVWVVAIGG